MSFDSSWKTNSYFVFVDKPVGPTSHDELKSFKRALKIKKLGHHGSLDPFASGLLLVGVNEATKFFQFVEDDFKTYAAVLKLGEATDTLDHTGQVVKTAALPDWTEKDLARIAQEFTGDRQQIPPMYSAKKVDGKKLCDLARKGIEIKREPITIHIHSLELKAEQNNHISFVARVSRGTYIRVLGEQIAEALGTVGHLTALRRTELCDLSDDLALDWREDQWDCQKQIGIADLLKHLPALECTEKQSSALKNGQFLTLSELPVPLANGDLFRLFEDNQFFGVGERKGPVLKAKRLLSTN
ncbi:MAG: tRNA pseudouridine(55) synthase TruB [Deltaproteobacteria bacterium]|nr:tRNA pseudouridine(55) synthase TruB [Deltaproteobacteria bacterium]